MKEFGMTNLSFKLWLETADIDNLIQDVEFYGRDYVSMQDEKHKGHYEGRLAKVISLIRQAQNDFITPDDLRFIKDEVSNYVKNLSFFNKFNQFAREESEKRYRGLSDEEKRSQIGQKITDPMDLLLNTLWFGMDRYSANKTYFNKKATKQLIEQLPSDIQELIKQYLENCDRVIAVKEKIESLKEKVKKKSEIKKAQKEAETARVLSMKPIVSINAVEKLTTKVEDFLKGLKDEYINKTKVDLENNAKKFVNENSSLVGVEIDSEKKNELLQSIHNLSISGLVKMSYSVRNQSFESIELVPDFKTKLEPKANEMWSNIYEFFKGRMIRKLGPLVDEKAKQTESSDFTFTIISAYVSDYTIEGRFSLKFTDGSSFSVTHQIESSYSIHGKYFLRFPTRFSDITLADGTHFNALSEDILYKKFANIEKPPEEPVSATV